MQTYLDCYPCLLRQALSAARRAGANHTLQHNLMSQVLGLLQEIAPGDTPPAIAWRVHRAVRSATGAADPYRKAKAVSTRQALALYPRLKETVAASTDPLETAVRLSIAGNIIDYGVSDEHADLWQTAERVLSQSFAVCDLTPFRQRLARAEHVLFLADNAGETVFDRVLVEALPVPVIYAVKAAPILNDATRADAVAAGLNRCATLIDNGTDAPGTVWGLCSASFRRAFETAPLIIAKGQGNYETLSNAGPTVFCLLQAKCPVIARDLGTPVKSIVIRQCKR